MNVKIKKPFRAVGVDDEYKELHDDLIKRSDVYKAVDDWLAGRVPNLNTKDIPSADRPQGEWIDKAIHTLYEKLKTGNFMCVVPYGDKGRYATYYAEDRLYLVFDLWYHGLFLVEAKSPRDAIDQVNCDRLAYVPKGVDDEDA